MSTFDDPFSDLGADDELPSGARHATPVDYQASDPFAMPADAAVFDAPGPATRPANPFAAPEHHDDPAAGTAPADDTVDHDPTSGTQAPATNAQDETPASLTSGTEDAGSDDAWYTPPADLSPEAAFLFEEDPAPAPHAVADTDASTVIPGIDIGADEAPAPEPAALQAPSVEETSAAAHLVDELFGSEETKAGESLVSHLDDESDGATLDVGDGPGSNEVPGSADVTAPSPAVVPDEPASGEREPVEADADNAEPSDDAAAVRFELPDGTASRILRPESRSDGDEHVSGAPGVPAATESGDETPSVPGQGTATTSAAPSRGRATQDAGRLMYPTADDAVLRDVDQLLGLMASHAGLQQTARAFQLTRDRTVDVAQRNQLEADLRLQLGNVRLAATPAVLPMVFNRVYDELLGLGPLGPAWRDNDVTEILVDDWDDVYVERQGQLRDTNLTFRNIGHAQSIAKQFSRIISDRELSPANPLVTAQLPGARVNFAYGAVTSTGIAISLRKFVPLLGVDQLIGLGALNVEMRDFLADAVAARATTLVSGGTGVGKTTLINALSEFIPSTERVVSIEDSFELTLTNNHWKALQTKERSSADDTVDITQDMLLVNALRMRPDRIIVGEIRDPAAATTMLNAANTGHEGTMTTVHADSVDRALNGRLAMLARVGGDMPDEIAKTEVAAAIDIVVQGVRMRGRRFISEIALVEAGAVTGGHIVPVPLFKGRLEGDDVVFRQTAGIGPDSALAARMRDAGIDPGRWN